MRSIRTIIYMDVRVFRGVQNYVIQQKFRPMPMKGIGFEILYFEIILGLKNRIVLSISNFTKLWPLELNFCDIFYILFIH